MAKNLDQSSESAAENLDQPPHILRSHKIGFIVTFYASSLL